MPLGIKIAKNIIISGLYSGLGKGYEELYQEGIEALFSIVNRPMSLEEAMSKVEQLLERIARDDVSLEIWPKGSLINVISFLIITMQVLNEKAVSGIIAKCGHRRPFKVAVESAT